MEPATPSHPRVFAIVPAAGRSRRMGSPKQLLPYGERTVLGAVLEPLLVSRVAGVVLMTRPGLLETLTPSSPRLAIAINLDPETPMIASVRGGLDEWARRAEPGPRDGFLVCPGDQPGLGPEEIDACLLAFEQSPESIIVASHDGRRGHPLIFPQALVPFVRSAQCDGGLNALPRAHASRIREVPLTSPAVTRNINTPEDYRRLQG